jgi:hypothetical protein
VAQVVLALSSFSPTSLPRSQQIPILQYLNISVRPRIRHHSLPFSIQTLFILWTSPCLSIHTRLTPVGAEKCILYKPISRSVERVASPKLYSIVALPLRPPFSFSCTFFQSRRILKQTNSLVVLKTNMREGSGAAVERPSFSRIATVPENELEENFIETYGMGIKCTP